MNTRVRTRRPALYAVAATCLVAGLALASSQGMPFGGEEDVAFAGDLWTAMDGYQNWPMRSEIYPGTSPHGAFLRLYYGLVNLDGEAYHVIVKDNFGGPDATERRVAADPGQYLRAVTVMVQRDPGYDPENGDWYWVKYAPDGSLDTNAKGRKLAGRVAKGADQGCLACHGNAGGGDYVFTND